MSNCSYKYIYENLLFNKKETTDITSIKQCIDIASKNKVLLGFLRKANITGKVRYREEKKYANFLKDLQLVVESLSDLEYLLIKLYKPVKYVPADLDVLVNREDIARAVFRLKNKGFKIEVVEPYCITMVRGKTIVDLYIHPTLGGMIYLPGNSLFPYKQTIIIDGVKIPVLEESVETLLVIAHALYKERRYTLNDYITVRKWLSKKTIKIAEKLKVIDSIKLVYAINKSIEASKIELPYKLPISKWLLLWGLKIIKDKTTRTTIFQLISSVKDKRFGKLILLKTI